MKKLKTSLAMICIMLASVVLSACGLEIELSADATIVAPGGHVQLVSKATDESLKAEDFTYSILSGTELATLSESGLLTIKTNAVPDSIIKVQSSYQDTKSNTLEIKVGKIALTGINIFTPGNINTAEIGSSLTLNATLTPTNTTEKNLTWAITQGDTLAEVVTTSAGVTKLNISNSAPIGSIIKVKATCGSVTSNELTITTTEALSVNRTIMVNQNIELDYKNSTQNEILTPELVDGLGNEDTNAEFECSVLSGSDYLSVDTEDNKNFNFTIKGHGQAIVVVSALGRTGVVSKQVNVNVIVPPTAVSAPNYLTDYQSKNEGNGDKYQVGVKSNVNDNYLPFTPVAVNGDELTGGVCQDVKVEFKHESENVFSNTSGTFANNQLTFTKTGIYDIKVTSNSGSDQEVSDTIQVEVNNFKNVYNYAQFKTAVEARQSVNVIVSEKAVYTGYNEAPVSDFDLVPEFILNHSWTDDQSLFNLANNARISCDLTTTFNSITINGNDHKINLISMPLINKTIANDQNDLGSLLSIQASYILDEYGVNQENILPKNGTDPVDTSKLDNTKYFVKINDLSIAGACGVTAMSDNPQDWQNSDYTLTDTGYFAGFYNRGIQIGNDRAMKFVNLQMNNVSVSGFSIGMRISGTKTIDDEISYLNNVKVDNIFKAGMELSSNILTIKNSTLGFCGQGSLEITPDSCNYAGNSFNGHQQIIFENNSITDASISDYSTPYFQYFASSAGQPTILNILAGELLAMYNSGDEDQSQLALSIISHIMNDFNCNTEGGLVVSGEVGFVALVFNSLNVSELLPLDDVFDYKNSDDLADLTENNNKIMEKYIKIYLPSGYGYAYLQNLKYDENHTSAQN